jgi:hypothetical protein
MPEPPVQPPYEDEFGPELREQLDQEISRLPDKYRIAIVLCVLQGRSRPDVAQELRLPEGTVGSRLARGRALLARRLARRGLTLSATSFAAVCSHQAASGAVPVALLTNTIEATRLLAAGNAVAAGLISSEVTPLTEAVLQALAVAKHKTVGVVVVLAALVLGGGAFAYDTVAGLWAKPTPPSEPIKGPNAVADPAKNALELAKAEIEKYGSEKDAKECALELVASTYASRAFDPKAAMEAIKNGACDLKLDRDTGRWTVTGTYVTRIFGFRFQERPEERLDWKVICYYRRSDRTWHIAMSTLPTGY